MFAASFTGPSPFDVASPMPKASETEMRKSGEFVRNVGVLDPHLFGERIAAFLRREHPTKTAPCVEAITGIPAKTVAKWLEGASAPSGSAYHRLIKTYGPELFVFVSPEASPESIRRAAAECQQARLEAQAATIRTQMADVLRRL